MSNLSIEAQVAYRCFAAEQELFLLRDSGSLINFCNNLKAELKAIVSVERPFATIDPECYAGIDRGVNALLDAGILNTTDVAVEAIRSIVQCVSENEIRRAARLFLNLGSF